MKTALRPAVIAAAVFTLLLQACSTAPRRASDETAAGGLYETRQQKLADLTSWELRARIAISDGDRGGSGNLRWSVAGTDTLMDFHGALGRGAWRLAADPQGAVLELADGSVYRAPTVVRLAEQQLDWSIPVDALSWWVLGLQAPGAVESQQLSESGTPMSLAQKGWLIEYGRYDEVDGVSLPVKLTARRDGRMVKLVIREWKLGSRDG